MSAVPVESDEPRASRQDKHGLRILTSRRVAIILFNLGGPDEPRAVRPFLFNLFNDPAIVPYPQPLRLLLATLIARSREAVAQTNYDLIGGRSPIMAETLKQAEALDAAIAKRIDNVAFKSFPAMRYWKPYVKDAAKAAEAWGATDAILMPLYPQFSTTTTGSSLDAWKRASKLPASVICCYPVDHAFAQAHAEAITETWRNAGSPPNPRVLFSAHGLPKRVVEAGDPYQWQVEQSVAAVKRALPREWDTRICYQSRVGPLTWLGPSTEAEVMAAARDLTGVIVAPIAFVSEHVETLVELDIEYAQLAAEWGAPFYLRAPALGTAPRFIDALADLVERALQQPGTVQSASGGRICPAEFGRCAQQGS